jgi:hypothetical protein
MHARYLMMAAMAALAMSACGGSAQTLESKILTDTSAEWRDTSSQHLARVYVEPKSGATVTVVVVDLPDGPEDEGTTYGAELVAMAAPSTLLYCPLTWEAEDTFMVKGPPEILKDYYDDVYVLTRQTFSDSTSGMVRVSIGDDGRGYVICGRWPTEVGGTMFGDFYRIAESLELSPE